MRKKRGQIVVRWIFPNEISTCHGLKYGQIRYPNLVVKLINFNKAEKWLGHKRLQLIKKSIWHHKNSLVARLAWSYPRNNSFSACWSFAFLISSLDIFKNCINSYHIDSEQIYTCLRIIWIVTLLILNKFRHV